MQDREFEEKIKNAKLKPEGLILPETVVYEQALFQFLSLIEMTPMHEGLKSLLRLRLRHRMPIEDVAFLMKEKIEYVISLEEEAKYYIQEFLKKHGALETIKRLESEPRIISGLINELANPSDRPQEER